MNRNQRWNCNVIRYATFQARQSKAKEAKEKEKKTIKHTFQKNCYSQTLKKRQGQNKKYKKEVCLA